MAILCEPHGCFQHWFIIIIIIIIPLQRGIPDFAREIIALIMYYRVSFNSQRDAVYYHKKIS